MKSLSISVVAMATLFLVLCTSFRSGDESLIPGHGHSVVKDGHFYYYLAAGDTYDGFNTTAQEIARLELMYGVYVDTSPFGGTLLARGYIVNIVPHPIGASCFLYGHF